MSQTNVELAKRGFAAIAAGDLQTVAQLLAPDVKWHAGDPDAKWACRSREQALAYMRGRQTPQRAGQLLDVIDAGDRVVVVLQPPPDEDGVAPPPRANVTTIRDGQVVEMVGFDSPQDALAHVGHNPDTSG